MPNIFVDIDAAGSAQVVKVGNICYNRVGNSETAVDTPTVDGQNINCDECIVPGGLIARYLFADFTDETGNHDLTNNGSHTLGTDPNLGTVLDMVKLSDASGLPEYSASANGYTVTMWFNQAGSNPAGFGYHILDGSQFVSIDPEEAPPEVTIRNLGSNGDSFLQPASGLTEGTWHFIAMTLDVSASPTNVFEAWLGEIDGTLIKENSDSGVGGTLAINEMVVGDFYEGMMTKLSFWDRTLTDAELLFMFDNKL